MNVCLCIDVEVCRDCHNMCIMVVKAAMNLGFKPWAPSHFRYTFFN